MSKLHDIRDPLITTQQGRFSDERLYTLKEVEELGREWAKTRDLTSNDRWLISHLFAWLKRREKEERS